MISPSALKLLLITCIAVQKKIRSPPPLATFLSLSLSILSFFLLSLFLLGGGGGGGSFLPLYETLLAMNKHTAKFTIKIFNNYDS